MFSNGAHDKYDSYYIYIDKKYIELASLFKTSSDFSETKGTPTISFVEAITIATTKMDLAVSSITIELVTVKTNNCFDDDIVADEIKLAYIVKDHSLMVYVDAYTGEIIGGDILKAIRGGAIGAIELSTASKSVALAKKTLQKMGYNRTLTSITTQFKTEVPTLLNYAFYSCSHGSSSVISSIKKNDDENRQFHASSVPSGLYKLFFLDACNTSSATWKNTFGISNASKYKAFLGWGDTVGTLASYEFCKYFWGGISTNKSIRQVAIDAASAQDEGLRIQFTGDRAYNGYCN